MKSFDYLKNKHFTTEEIADLSDQGAEVKFLASDKIEIVIDGNKLLLQQVIGSYLWEKIQS